MRTASGALLLIIACVATGHSQPRVRGSEPPSRFLYFQAVNLPASDTATSRVDILYRVERNFFVAVRNTDTTFPWEFIRRGEIAVELHDSTGTSRAREIQQIVLGENEALQNPEMKIWHQGIVSLEVPPGNYHAVLELTDLESKRDYIDRQRVIHAAAFGRAPLEINASLFVSAVAPAPLPDTLLAQNFGADVLWGSRGSLFVMLGGTALADSAVTVRTKLSADDPESEGSGHQVVAESLFTATPFGGIRLLPLTTAEGAGYRVVRAAGERTAALFVGFRSETLPLRAYRLSATVTQGSHEQTVERRFRMVWPDMPSSLRNVDYAIDALRYITTDGQRDSLKRGDPEERRTRLEEFWKMRGGTGGSAISELMVQYYRRVDYAARHFGTLRQSDGSKSDRGRIYILHGPPTSTERSLNPRSGYTEVWRYERLNRKFTFIDQDKNGNYVLLSSSAL